MQTIYELLKKIQWDPDEHPEEYSVFYFDRVKKRLVEVTYEDIVDVQDGVMIVNMFEEEVDIPLHRVREVRRSGKLIWQRPKSEVDYD
jgi:uncharacterized protein (UPF0248 family)